MQILSKSALWFMQFLYFCIVTKQKHYAKLDSFVSYAVGNHADGFL